MKWPTPLRPERLRADPHGAGGFHCGSIGILITAMPFKCPAALYETAFLLESYFRDRKIRRKVEIHLFTPEHTPMPVAAAEIGDATTIKLPNGKALPKAGVFAHYEAEVVAKNIAAEIRGKKSGASFEGKGFCWIELGDGRAGFAGGNFYVEPDPQLKMRRPGRLMYWGKVAFEKWWLTHWF